VLAHDADLLRWQHARPGNEERLSVVAAEREGKLLAIAGIVAFDACVDGARYRGGWITNWVVVPELQGAGLGRALVAHAQRELDLAGALAENEAAAHVLGRLGFAELRMARWVRVFSEAALEQLLADSPVPYPPAAWAAWRAQEASGVVPEGTGVRPWTDGERWDAVWRERLTPHLVGGSRDAAHIRRRFLEHPRFHYDLLTVETPGGEPGGFAAYRIEAVRGADALIMRIVDLIGVEAEHVTALLAGLVNVARSEGVVFADFACTSPRVGGPLAAAGFANEDTLPAALPGRFQPLDFTDRPLVCSFWASPRIAPDSRDFFRARDLYVTRSDSDLDRPN